MIGINSLGIIFIIVTIATLLFIVQVYGTCKRTFLIAHRHDRDLPSIVLSFNQIKEQLTSLAAVAIVYATFLIAVLICATVAILS